MSKKSNKDFRNTLLSAILADNELKKTLKKYKNINKQVRAFEKALPFDKYSDEHLINVSSFILNKIKKKFCLRECYFLVSVFIKPKLYPFMEGSTDNINVLLEEIIYDKLAGELGIDNIVSVPNNLAGTKSR